jgi:hypothetical protein
VGGPGGQLEKMIICYILVKRALSIVGWKDLSRSTASRVCGPMVKGYYLQRKLLFT